MLIRMNNVDCIHGYVVVSIVVLVIDENRWDFWCVTIALHAIRLKNICIYLCHRLELNLYIK